MLPPKQNKRNREHMENTKGQVIGLRQKDADVPFFSKINEVWYMTP